jgi:DNA-directed RNA polymerase subunit RPC12/RpoP
MKNKQCCFCKIPIRHGQGNNPEPVKSSKYICCDSCNFKVVIQARMQQVKEVK